MQNGKPIDKWAKIVQDSLWGKERRKLQQKKKKEPNWARGTLSSITYYANWKYNATNHTTRVKNTRFGNRTQLSHIQLHFLAVMLGKLTTISFPGFSHLLNAVYAKTTEPGKPKTASTKHRCDQEHSNKKLNSDRQIRVSGAAMASWLPFWSPS